MSVTIMIGDVREQLRKIDVAYCAGVIDSDGTIGIKKLTYSMRVIGNSRQPTYTARICVRQVTREAVDLLSALFGGPVSISKPSLKNGRPLFQWEARDAAAERVLIAIIPFLRIKKRQAENCMLLRALIAESKIARVAVGRGHVGGASRPTHISEKMELAYLNAKSLNIVGAKCL